MSEDFKLFLEDFEDSLNAEEARVVKLRAQIRKILGDTKPSAKLPFDASKIKWQDRENEKGKFQMTEDFDNPEYKALISFLSERGGCLTSEGLFYWTYSNGSTIGRKLWKGNQ